MNVLQISELEYPIGNGITHPLISTAKSGEKVVVKLNNNMQGNLVLVNEYIGYMLSVKLELPVADSGVCMVDEKTIIHPNARDGDDLFSDENYGLGFYSTYIENATVINSSKMVMLAENYEWVIPKLLLFDHLIYNVDRNKGNLLLTMRKDNKRIILIDNSHAFKLGTIWDSSQFRRGIDEDDYRDTTVMECNKYLYKILIQSMNLSEFHLHESIEYFRSRLTESDIAHIVDSVPIEWGVNKDELDSLKEYLIYRLEKLEAYVDVILNYSY